MFLKLVLFFSMFPLIVQSQSVAHSNSRFAIIDPAYSSGKTFPATDIDSSNAHWIYGPTELESYRLQLLGYRKDTAKLKVNYPGVFHKPYEKAIIRLSLKRAVRIKSLVFRANGYGSVYLNKKLLKNFMASRQIQKIALRRPEKISVIEFSLNAPNDIPALLLMTPQLLGVDKQWQWKVGKEDWQLASEFYQNKADVPPHQYENPVIRLAPISMQNNVYDFNKELLGYLYFKTKEKPQIVVGESVSEALNTNPKYFEQSLEVLQATDSTWRSKVPLAFRYVHVKNALPKSNIYAEAIFHPEIYKGAFFCSDTLLTHIWMNSAYTLRLCMQDFLLDGIKRDRMPWAGDMAMSILSNAYTFADADIVRRSLIALGSAGIKEKDINGIVDYSLWWVISQDLYQLYYGDREFLKRNWKHIKEFLEDLDRRGDKEGFLTVRKNDWVFIDWVNQPKWTTLQILWWWAKKSGANLAARMGDKELETKLSREAEKLKVKLSDVAWDTLNGIWMSSQSKNNEKMRHPNFLSVVSGLTNSTQYEGISKLLNDNNVREVGTPYMAGFEMMALADMGQVNAMIKKVESYWGGMLEKGATTFWEAYNPSEKGDQSYNFYNRPFAKSLCHAWSAGPAVFLPAGLLGLEPLEDGWKKFTMKPNIGTLKTLNVSVPTPYGNIIVDILRGKMTVEIPNGTSFYWKGKNIYGPQVVIDSL